MTPAEPADSQDQPLPAEPADEFLVPTARPISADPWPVEMIPDPKPRGGLSAWGAFWQIVSMIPIAFLSSEIGILIFGAFGVTDQRWQQVLATIFGGFACIAFAVFLTYLSRQTAATMGLHANRFFTEIYVGLIATVAIFIALIILSSILATLAPHLHGSEEARKAIEKTLPPMSVPVMLLMLMLVSIWEETVFRGFLLTRLRVIVGSWWLAIVISAILFSLGHLYEGWLAMIPILGLGVALGALFAWRKSLVSCIVCHTLFNAIMLLTMQLIPPDFGK